MSTYKPTGPQKRSVPKKSVPRKSVRKKVDWKALEIVHPDAAGVDVGASEHGVAIRPDRDPEPVQQPLTLLDIALAPGNVLGVLGIY